MRMSEAIRLGSMLGPQSRGHLQRTHRKYFFGLIGPLVTEYCALGAAFKASGARTIEAVAERDNPGFRGGAIRKGEKVAIVDHEWGALSLTVASCPACALEPPPEATPPSMPLYRLIPHLNDDHRWSRGRIADFVELVEQRIDASQAIEVHVAVDFP